MGSYADCGAGKAEMSATTPNDTDIDSRFLTTGNLLLLYRAEGNLPFAEFDAEDWDAEFERAMDKYDGAWRELAGGDNEDT